MKKYLYWVLIEVMTNKDNTKQWYRVNAANDDEAVKKVFNNSMMINGVDTIAKVLTIQNEPPVYVYEID